MLSMSTIMSILEQAPELVEEEFAALTAKNRIGLNILKIVREKISTKN